MLMMNRFDSYLIVIDPQNVAVTYPKFMICLGKKSTCSGSSNTEFLYHFVLLRAVLFLFGMFLKVMVFNGLF